MKNQKQVEEIAIKIKSLPITKTLYSLKEQGKTPVIRVKIEDGKPVVAVLRISEIDYYFHNTKDKDGNSIEIKLDGDRWEIPFDGLSLS